MRKHALGVRLNSTTPGKRALSRALFAGVWIDSRVRATGMYIHTFIHTYVYLNILHVYIQDVCVCVYIYMYMYMHACLYTCMYACMCICVCNIYTRAHTDANNIIWACACLRHSNRDACIHTHTHIHTYMKHTYHTYAQKHIHLHTRAHTHTQDAANIIWACARLGESLSPEIFYAILEPESTTVSQLNAQGNFICQPLLSCGFMLGSFVCIDA